MNTHKEPRLGYRNSCMRCQEESVRAKMTTACSIHRIAPLEPTPPSQIEEEVRDLDRRLSALEKRFKYPTKEEIDRAIKVSDTLEAINKLTKEKRDE